MTRLVLRSVRAIRTPAIAASGQTPLLPAAMLATCVACAPGRCDDWRSRSVAPTLCVRLHSSARFIRSPVISAPSVNGAGGGPSGDPLGAPWSQMLTKRVFCVPSVVRKSVCAKSKPPTSTIPMRTSGTVRSMGTTDPTVRTDFGTRLGGSVTARGVTTGCGNASGSPVSIAAMPVSAPRSAISAISRGVRSTVTSSPRRICVRGSMSLRRSGSASRTKQLTFTASVNGWSDGGADSVSSGAGVLAACWSISLARCRSATDCGA